MQRTVHGTKFTYVKSALVNGQIYTDTFKTIKQAEKKYIETLKFLRDFDSKMLLEGWILYLTDITLDRVYKMDKGDRDYTD